MSSLIQDFSKNEKLSKTVYMPPEAQTVILKNFDLSKIEEYFHFASFERKISTRKTHMIAHAIMDNKFTDNVLRVVPGSTSAKYDVLDGQHRIEGLRYARDEMGLEIYDLIIFVYNGGNQREIYRRLNLGKPLTLTDHLKALDTGKVVFFNDLRKHCDHYRAGGMIRFATAINCLHYAKSTSIRSVRPLQIDDFIKSVTKRDTKTVNEFIPILQQIATNPESIFYHYTLMRNFFRIFYENNLSVDEMLKLGDVLKKSGKIKEMAEKRDTYAMRGIYHYIIDIAAPKVGLNLEKGTIKE
jgi:hypothetical protein